MTKEETLVKTIQKAIDGGWQEQLREDPWHIHEGRMPGRFDLCVPLVDQATYHIDFYGIIYDHEVAQAIWGKFERTCMICGNNVDTNCHNDSTIGEAWQFHLQQMVVAEDPIAYLEKNI